jgi:hypothetical protein
MRETVVGDAVGIGGIPPPVSVANTGVEWFFVGLKYLIKTNSYKKS